MNSSNRLNYFTGVIFIALLLIARFAVAQQTDAGLWTNFTIEKEITKKWSLYVEQEVRLKENYSQLDRLYTEIGGSYKPAKGLKISLAYRFIAKEDLVKYYWNDFRFGHRAMFEIFYKYRYRSLTFLYKTRIESEMKYIYSSDKGKVAGWHWKNKFEIKYRLMRFEPFIGTELRYQFRDPRHPESDWLLNRIWIYAGVDISIIKYHTLGIYYLLQKEWNLTNAENRYILGLQYSILFPAEKKKKSKKK